MRWLESDVMFFRDIQRFGRHVCDFGSPRLEVINISPLNIFPRLNWLKKVTHSLAIKSSSSLQRQKKQFLLYQTLARRRNATLEIWPSKPHSAQIYCDIQSLLFRRQRLLYTVRILRLRRHTHWQ